jgi:hypothetical protein
MSSWLRRADYIMASISRFSIFEFFSFSLLPLRYVSTSSFSEATGCTMAGSIDFVVSMILCNFIFGIILYFDETSSACL